MYIDAVVTILGVVVTVAVALEAEKLALVALAAAGLLVYLHW